MQPMRSIRHLVQGRHSELHSVPGHHHHSPAASLLLLYLNSTTPLLVSPLLLLSGLPTTAVSNSIVLNLRVGTQKMRRAIASALIVRPSSWCLKVELPLVELVLAKRCLKPFMWELKTLTPSMYRLIHCAPVLPQTVSFQLRGVVLSNKGAVHWHVQLAQPGSCQEEHCTGACPCMLTTPTCMQQQQHVVLFVQDLVGCWW